MRLVNIRLQLKTLLGVCFICCRLDFVCVCVLFHIDATHSTQPSAYTSASCIRRWRGKCSAPNRTRSQHKNFRYHVYIVSMTLKNICPARWKRQQTTADYASTSCQRHFVPMTHGLPDRARVQSNNVPDTHQVTFSAVTRSDLINPVSIAFHQTQDVTQMFPCERNNHIEYQQGLKPPSKKGVRESPRVSMEASGTPYFGSFKGFQILSIKPLT